MEPNRKRQQPRIFWVGWSAPESNPDCWFWDTETNMGRAIGKPDHRTWCARFEAYDEIHVRTSIREFYPEANIMFIIEKDRLWRATPSAQVPRYFDFTINALAPEFA